MNQKLIDCWVRNGMVDKLKENGLDENGNPLNEISEKDINDFIKGKDNEILNYKPSWEYMKYLGDPNLFNIIVKEFDKGVQGEQKSKEAIFLSLCSIWNQDSEVPINTLVSSESSSGKSFLCKKIIKIFPKELVHYRTKISPEAFTYWHTNDPDWTWDGKICYLEDISQALLDSQPFKVMCSEGSTATVVIKQKAVDLEINGKPVMLITTAKTDPNTEILNRFQIISLDETAKQTEDIVFRIAKDQKGEPYNSILIKSLSFLKRRKVKITFGLQIAQYLKENYNFNSLRMRRDFSRLMDLIKASAVLYQYQRDTNDFGEIIANEQDYQIARKCINYIQDQTFRGLTHQLKKAYKCCKEMKEFTAIEIHDKYPIVNQKMWYNYLNRFLEGGMLKVEKREQTGTKDDGKLWKVKTTYFSICNETSFELPEFKDLPKFITNDTIDTNNTNNTKCTKDINDCNDCNDFIKNNYLDQPMGYVLEGKSD